MMARATTLTKLPLDRWAQLLGLNPLHYNGIYIPDQPITVCAQPWMQYAHQAVDRLGREDIALAIAQAEADIEEVLGFRVAPAWEVDEWQATIRPYRPELINISVTDVRGYGQNVQADWGYFISGGVRAKTVIAPDVAITYTDVDGDLYLETATITVPTIVTDPDEIAVYFPASNAGTPIGLADDAWQVRPIKVSFAGGVATIKMSRHQLVRPEAYEHLTPMPSDSQQRGVDGLVAANFLEKVDVVRVYNDPSQQVTFLWEQSGGGGCSCGSGLGAACPTRAYAVQAGCLLLRDKPKNSIVVYQPGMWNVDTLSFDSAAWAVCRQPDLVRFWYYAGYRGNNTSRLLIDGMLERMVAYYAASLLDRSVCECDNIQAWIERLRTDMATDISGVARHKLKDSELSNPFGTRLGALEAWRKATSLARGEPAAIL